MPYIVADRVKETALVVGTGSITCLGAVSGYLPFSSKMSIGDTCSYITFNYSQSQWETGIGTYSASGVISRTTVKTSSNNNNKIVFNGDVVNILIGQTVANVPNYNPITQTLSANPISSGNGNNLNIIGGSGAISGSGGDLILRGGIHAGTGIPGKVIVQQVSGQTANLQEWQNASGTVLCSINASGTFQPISIADASAPNNSIYYSTTASKLVYKSSNGTVNNLY